MTGAEKEPTASEDLFFCEESNIEKPGIAQHSARFFFSFTLVLAIRGIFSFFDIIPLYFDLRPDIGLLFLMVLCWGWAALLGGALGALCGDIFLNVAPELIAYRLAGIIFAARVCMKGMPYRSPPLRLLGIFLICVVAALTNATWYAFGLEVHRFYPFIYMFPRLFLHDLIFVMLNCFLLVWILKIRPEFSQVKNAALGILLFLLGTLGIVFVFFSLIIFFDYSCFRTVLLGEGTGTWMGAVLSFLLLLQILGIYWPTPRQKIKHMPFLMR